MKKNLLLILLHLSAIVHAQDFWTVTYPFPTTPYHVDHISIADESTVWVVGTNYDATDDFSVWRWGLSTDGGLTWTDGQLPDEATFPQMSYYHITNIIGISNQTAYVGAAPNHPQSTNKLLVTNNAGATWTQIHPELFNGTNSFLAGVHFFDTNHGIVFGDPTDNYFEIYTTSDAAATWNRVPSANIPSPLPGEYCIVNHFDTAGSIIRFLTSESRLFSSPDQGLTWTVSQAPANPNLLDQYGGSFYGHRYFSFKDANEGILVTAGNAALHQTLDGGITWNPVTTSGSLSDRSVVYVPQTSGTFYNTGRLTEQGSSWSSGYSTDNGNSWIQMTENPEFIPIITAFFSPTVGYASGYQFSNPYFGFYRLTDPLDRLLKKKSFLETTFSATPNPTKERVKINGELIQSVNIHDATGKEIYEQSFAGTKEAEIDLSVFGNGIYFAKITTQKGTSTIKIIKN